MTADRKTRGLRTREERRYLRCEGHFKEQRSDMTVL